MNKSPIFIFGGNEIASAIALWLYRATFPVVMYADPASVYLRYNLCFGECVRQETRQIENVTASLLPPEKLAEFTALSPAQKIADATEFLFSDRKIPVLSDSTYLADLFELLQPRFCINTSAELPEGFEKTEYITWVGLYPDQVPGIHCDVSVETRLVYPLGKSYFPGEDIPEQSALDLHFFKNPFDYCELPIEGVWIASKQIGETVAFKEPLGKVGEIEIRSPFEGQIWGIAHSGQMLAKGTRVAVVYLGPATENYRYFGFQHHAVAGGVLKTILHLITL